MDDIDFSHKMEVVCDKGDSSTAGVWKLYYDKVLGDVSGITTYTLEV